MIPSAPHDETRLFEEALAAQPKSAHYCLRLFVTGNTAKSARAIRNIRAICEETLKGRYDLAVIDIYQHPEQLKPEQIIVTPTLIKMKPYPARRIIGDLSNRERLLAGLDIPAPDEVDEPPVDQNGHGKKFDRNDDGV